MVAWIYLVLHLSSFFLWFQSKIQHCKLTNSIENVKTVDFTSQISLTSWLLTGNSESFICCCFFRCFRQLWLFLELLVWIKYRSNPVKRPHCWCRKNVSLFASNAEQILIEIPVDRSYWSICIYLPSFRAFSIIFSQSVTSGHWYFFEVCFTKK